MPRLPRPRELKPFPNALSVEYVGHASRVRCIACSPDGQWLASGDDDGVLILWEVRRDYVTSREGLTLLEPHFSIYIDFIIKYIEFQRVKSLPGDMIRT